jgi:hypothetical protein
MSEFNDVLVEFPGISDLQKMVETHHTPHGQRLIFGSGNIEFSQQFINRKVRL